jgi:diacylglycerol kinase (ATP)
MRGEIVFIINPFSGKWAKGPIRKTKIDSFIERKGLKARSILTERACHATELAQQCLQEGAARVICVGGDGTMNEVARVLVGTDIPFGLVPMGSGNGLARHLGLPLRFEDALENARQCFASIRAR